MRRIKRVGGAAALAVLGFLSFQAEAHAVFTLDVTPSRGGRDIRFDSVREGRPVRNEEVTFTVTTDEAKQYQITQTLMFPLVNERGEALPPSAIKIFSPSSVLGVLRASLATDLTAGTGVLYTSNAAGAGDSFNLVFALELAQTVSGGIYESQIVYTLEAVSGGEAPVTVTRNIRLEVLTDFKITVRNRDGGSVLDLGRITKDNLTGEGVLVFEIESNIGGPFRIYQNLTDPLSDATGRVIGPQRVLFRPAGAANGVMTIGAGTLSASPQLIYTSGAEGRSDTFEVAYAIEQADREQAGTYRSTVSFSVEADSGFLGPKTVNVPIALDVSAIFYLDIQYEGAGLSFGFFSGPEDTNTRRVMIKVFNNLGAPYQISQVVTGPMMNDEGSKIPPENFQFRVDGPQTGSFSASSKAPVKDGDSVIYISDDRGTPAELAVEYELRVPKDQRGGNYSTHLTFSMSAS